MSSRVGPPRLLPPPTSLPPDVLPPATCHPQADWIALIASADFFFNDSQNESMAENLRERVRYLAEKASSCRRWRFWGPAWPDEQEAHVVVATSCAAPSCLPPLLLGASPLLPPSCSFSSLCNEVDMLLTSF